MTGTADDRPLVIYSVHRPFPNFGQGIERIIQVGGGVFDLFNSLNVNTIATQTNRKGSTYLQPTEIVAPRVFRTGERFKF